MKVFFLMRHPGYARNWEWVLELLLERGHTVQLAFESDGHRADVVERLALRHPGRVAVTRVADRSDVWRQLTWSLGQSVDYLRYLAPVYRNASFLRERAKRDVPTLLLRASPLLGGRAGRALARVLRAWERALPVPHELAAPVRDARADVVLVTPLVSQHSQHDFVRSARASGFPIVLAVNSWDNLTNKGLVRELPDRTYVWNEAQRREAVELHGLPPGSVAAVGAHSFDHWFDWRPSSTREQFAARVGLDPARPFLLYVCSSLQVAGDERPFVRRWLDALRADPELRRVGVLVRPYPTATAKWEGDPFAGLPDVSLWPPEGTDPQDDRDRAEYYDSIFHSAAVVGLNTSALIEAAIVGRRTYTVVLPRDRDSQLGTLHFHYLIRERGGPVSVARSLEEHLAALRAAVRGGEDDEWRRPFLESFLRPQGLDVPAAPRLVEDLERFVSAFAPAPARGASALVAAASWPLARLSARPGGKRRPTLRRRLRHARGALVARVRAAGTR